MSDSIGLAIAIPLARGGGEHAVRRPRLGRLGGGLVRDRARWRRRSSVALGALLDLLSLPAEERTRSSPSPSGSGRARRASRSTCVSTRCRHDGLVVTGRRVADPPVRDRVHGARPPPGRFFAYMNLFVCFMLVLVLANDFLLLYLGWEGVGLCSYLLIGFWSRRPEAARAAKKAFITTRIGDVLLMLGLVRDVGALRLVRLRRRARSRGLAARDRRRHRDGDLAAAVRRRGRQVRPAAAARVAARRDGRAHPRLGPDPRGHDGDRGRLPGGAVARAVRDLGGRAHRRRRRRARRRPLRRALVARRSTT